MDNEIGLIVTRTLRTGTDGIPKYAEIVKIELFTETEIGGRKWGVIKGYKPDISIGKAVEDFQSTFKRRYAKTCKEVNLGLAESRC